MLDQDEDLDKEEEELAAKNKSSRKKLLILILPILIVIGLSVGFYYVFNREYKSSDAIYSIIRKPGADGAESITVFYDLPEIAVPLHNSGPDQERLLLRLNLELSAIEDVASVETMTARINDTVISHIIELTPAELEGSNGLYWLKEELFYRLNLVVAPVKLSGLNIKSFEIQREDNK